MSAKKTKLLACVLVYCLCAFTALAQSTVTAVYQSKKVYFSKPGKQRGSSEPYKEIDNGAGLYQLSIYTDHIAIRKTETTELKIVSFKQHKGETKYNLADGKGKHFELYISPVDKTGNTNITLTELDNSYAPIGTYMLVCSKY